MTATINASTSSGVVITPDNSGNILLQYNGVAAPAFSAYRSTTQSVTSGTWTKVACDAEEFDTASCFSTSTYRFTPTVAGYYQINGNINFSVSSGQAYAVTCIYKNGTFYKYGSYINGSAGIMCNVSSLVYLNGTTDYVELYGLLGGTGPSFIGDSTATYFNGCLLRGA